MSIPVGQSLDFMGNQIENVKAQNLGSDPGTPGLGQFWYNTATSTLKFYDGAIRTVAHLGTRLDQFAAPTASVAMNGQRLTGLADPTNATDAVTRQYVDAAIQGMKWKEPVRVATTGANITLTGGAPSTLDGKMLVANNRVLVKDQSTSAQNGIYIVATLGSGSNGTWTRATDMDSTSPTDEILGAAVFVSEGTANNNSSWVMTTDAPITLGATSLTWSQFGGGQSYTATSLGATGQPIYVQLSGSEFQFNKVGVGNTVGTALSISTISNVVTINFNPANVAVSEFSGTLPVAKGGTGGGTAAAAKTNLGFMTRFAQDLSTSATSYAITHGLGTLDVHVRVFEKGSPYREILCEIQHTDTNTVTLLFGAAPVANTYRVVVIG